jgi:hypothetical protein
MTSLIDLQVGRDWQGRISRLRQGFVEARRGDRFYSEDLRVERPMLTVRSKIGPYRRPSKCYLGWPKNRVCAHQRKLGINRKFRN